MISGQDLYNVLAAMVPLYVAMFLAYGSVKWWNIFTPQQCGGINRFVALFAVPLLSFEFISSNNPFTMNFRFLAADSLAKLIVLCLLALWGKFTRSGCLEWIITLFSLSTLPNTLVMGIPLLRAMYGNFSGDLMVQIVVLQCIIWYTLLLFLFEYMAACRLLAEQFPDTAGSIVSFKVEADVVSLDNGRDGLETETAVGNDGKLHVTVRKSTSSRPSCASKAGLNLTPRPSNMTGVEIYSIHSSRNPTPRGSSFNHSELNIYHPDSAFSLHSSKGPTPRTSNFDEETMISKGTLLNPSLTSPRYAPPLYMYSTRPPPPIPTLSSPKPMSSDPKPFGSDLKHDVATPGFGNAEAKEGGGELGRDEFSFGNRDPSSLTKMGSSSTAELAPKSKEMPPPAVMTKLILVMVWRKLIRNPNTYSSLIGLTWSLVSARWSLTMPTIVKGSIAILSNAGLGMAMFSLGLFMALQPRIIACGNTVAAFSMAVKFLTGPAVMAAASIAIGIRGDLLHVAIVQAALPQGIVPFVFAKEYNVHPDILSTGVIFGMLVALPVTLLYYFLLGL